MAKRKAGKEKSFDEWDMDLSKWQGSVVTTLENISKEQVELLKKLDQHFAWGQGLLDKYIPEFNKQIEVLNQVCKDLPEKGWCGKIDKMYADMYPEKEDSMPDKVKTLWYDRKILKWLLGAVIIAIITSSATLIIAFMKGVF